MVTVLSGNDYSLLGDDSVLIAAVLREEVAGCIVARLGGNATTWRGTCVPDGLLFLREKA